METRLCIDTDVIIDYLRGRDRLYEKLLLGVPFPCISAITHFELWCGAENGDETRRVEDVVAPLDIVPFGEREAKEAAKIYRHLKARGRMIGVKDILIAGTALANDLPLATRNVREFERVPNLRLFKD